MTTAPTITPTRTTPTILPEPSPGRRLRPDTVCPGQTQRIARRAKRELGR
jgi:hypothetical protein